MNYLYVMHDPYEWVTVGNRLSTLEQKKNTFLSLRSLFFDIHQPLTQTLKWHRMGVSGIGWELRLTASHHVYW